MFIFIIKQYKKIGLTLAIIATLLLARNYFQKEIKEELVIKEEIIAKKDIIIVKEKETANELSCRANVK